MSHCSLLHRFYSNVQRSGSTMEPEPELERREIKRMEYKATIFSSFLFSDSAKIWQCGTTDLCQCRWILDEGRSAGLLDGAGADPGAAGELPRRLLRVPRDLRRRAVRPPPLIDAPRRHLEVAAAGESGPAGRIFIAHAALCSSQTHRNARSRQCLGKRNPGKPDELHG